MAPADAVFLDAKIEAELQELDDESAAELLESIGQTERGLDALARAGFHTLRLQTFLTAGPKESRAWTIHQGDTAPKAAGVIHTDFEKGFIKAEIVSYDDLIEAGSMAAAKAAGKVRMEGKDYVMADGDVVEFRFNVWSAEEVTRSGRALIVVLPGCPASVKPLSLLRLRRDWAECICRWILSRMQCRVVTYQPAGIFGYSCLRSGANDGGVKPRAGQPRRGRCGQRQRGRTRNLAKGGGQEQCIADVRLPDLFGILSSTGAVWKQGVGRSFGCPSRRGSRCWPARRITRLGTASIWKWIR